MRPGAAQKYLSPLLIVRMNNAETSAKNDQIWWSTVREDWTGRTPFRSNMRKGVRLSHKQIFSYEVVPNPAQTS